MPAQIISAQPIEEKKLNAKKTTDLVIKIETDDSKKKEEQINTSPTSSLKDAAKYYPSSAETSPNPNTLNKGRSPKISHYPFYHRRHTVTPELNETDFDENCYQNCRTSCVLV